MIYDSIQASRELLSTKALTRLFIDSLKRSLMCFTSQS